MAKRNTRRPTFSKAEEAVIKDGYIEFKDTIEAALSNKVTKKDKDLVWTIITDRLNAIGPNVQRTLEEVHKKFKNLKQKNKENIAKENKSAIRTGGGPPVHEVS